MTKEPDSVSTFPLNIAREGQSVILVGFEGNGRSIRRLAELGLTPDTMLMVARAIRGQPIIVSVRGSTLAIDRKTADQIRVCLPDGSDKIPCGRPAQKQKWRRLFRRRGCD